MGRKVWLWIIVALVLVLALAVTAVIWIGVLNDGDQPVVPDASQEQTPGDNGEGEDVDTPPAKDPTEQNPGQEATENTKEATEPATQATEEPTEAETDEGPAVGPNETPWG